MADKIHIMNSDIVTKLIEPVTENNIVNSINILKKEKHINNFWIDSNFIKGKKYSDDYIDTNNKIGQLKIKKFVNTRLFNTPYSIVSKPIKQKQVISLNTDNEKYMFLQNASKEDLKKIKYYDYFGIRYDKEGNILYDFDNRIIYHNVEKDPEENDVLLIDKEDAEPMLDPFKYKHVFIDKHKFTPIMRYYVKNKESYEDNIPEFINKQQNGLESEIILPKRERSEHIEPITIEEEPSEHLEGVNEDRIEPPSEVLEKPDKMLSLFERKSVEPPSEHLEEEPDKMLTLFKRESVENLADNHFNNIVESLNEQDQKILGFILSGEEDEIENINPEDISDNLRTTLQIIKDEKIQSEKEFNKTKKDLRRTIIRYIDKYDDRDIAIDFNSDPERYNLNFILNYFREMSQDDFYKVNKRSIDAVQRRIDKLIYYNHMQDYYYFIPINQLNRLTRRVNSSKVNSFK